MTDRKGFNPILNDEKRVLIVGRPDASGTNNAVSTAKYSIFSFLPVAIREQFRRNGNIYFLVMGCLMFLGWNTSIFDSAVSPWTTLGPLAIVVSISLAQEGVADLARHRSDNQTNQHRCLVLRRADHLAPNKSRRGSQILDGKDVEVRLHRSNNNATGRKQLANTNDGNEVPDVERSDAPASALIAFESVKRMNMYAGDIVLIRNRDMIPADLILLASSCENGSAYIETSPIDGETNLKLRNSPRVPTHALEASSPVMGGSPYNDYNPPAFESTQQAVKRITRLSALGYPQGVSALLNPTNPVGDDESDQSPKRGSRLSRNDSFVKVWDKLKSRTSLNPEILEEAQPGPGTCYVAALTSETPNASVNTFSGKLTLPPLAQGNASVTIALDVDNMLLRGAVLRNTEWAIGVAVFTGGDTKLVQNSVQTPSKFSKLDQLINKTVLMILVVMITCVIVLSGFSKIQNDLSAKTNSLWYAGYNSDLNAPWPYFPATFTVPPKWEAKAPNFGQTAFTYITLLNNFVPLSLYMTVEVITLFMMFLIGFDKNMYHKKTNTPAVARSTIVTDLGQVEYVFSDKTGTLTQNVMRFKRCSVDGMIFGAPVDKASVAERENHNSHDFDDEGVLSEPFHPLRQLLIGSVPSINEDEDAPNDGLSYLGGASIVADSSEKKRQTLTFNAEMFLRVMSICHTVVVEKDLDKTPQDETSGETSNSSKFSFLNSLSVSLRKRKNRDSTEEKRIGSDGEVVEEKNDPTDKSLQGPALDHESSNLSGEDSAIQSGQNGKFATLGKSKDGSPRGFAYQAESPDEGALVSAASLEYGFQLLGRDSNGVQLACSSPSLLGNEGIVKGLKDGTLTAKKIAAETAMPVSDRRSLLFGDPDVVKDGKNEVSPKNDTPRRETWTILAVNKFESDRKRMSVIVRSPPELGCVPMLLCKGADSSMLDANICEVSDIPLAGENEQAEHGDIPSLLSRVSECNEPSIDMDEANFASSSTASPKIPNSVVALASEDDDSFTANDEEENNENDWELSAMLGIQSHLGSFASEGLRTLVLGIRILTEEECKEWLAKYKAAASSVKNRDSKLTEVAKEIECKIHIVGATAIEDKLQKGVPETIHKLESAGIKLWVLTGDKRETAIEIGYSTKVLTPKMHLTEVADNPALKVRTLIAMEFIRLVKLGKLSKYQLSSLNMTGNTASQYRCINWFASIGQFFGRARRGFRRFYFIRIKTLCGLCNYKSTEDILTRIQNEEEAAKIRRDPAARRLKVRTLADTILKQYLESPEGKKDRSHCRRHHSTPDDGLPTGLDPPSSTQSLPKNIPKYNDDEENLSLGSDSVPSVFNRAHSARAKMDLHRGRMTNASLRSLSIASITSRGVAASTTPVVDEDILSLASFMPDQGGLPSQNFDKKRRTILERVFAVDRDVRKGRLNKHLTKEKRFDLSESAKVSNIEFAPGIEEVPGVREGRKADAAPHHASVHAPRALVIEGAALLHLLGDPLLEEMLFAVASTCDAVIACRVSPKQKALLVKMVRNYVVPSPITLAIGDGANDVGMIQEAHVGVGISGLEGQQAVNSSDFAIAQFRFLEELLLIHGRWNFMRLSKVVLFSFYKNASMAGLLILFSRHTVYSGTPLFDQWVISMLNFVAGFPILLLGFFDRDLDKDYVRRNPHVYASGLKNEHLTMRTILRWVCLTLVHIYTIYHISGPMLELGGGMTSAFSGLMSNKDLDRPGDGEGGDLQVFGTTIYTCLIFTLAYKVLFETRSLVHGVWPAFTCRKNVGEGAWSRFAYTWIGVTWLSIIFYLAGIYCYSAIGRMSNSQFAAFAYVTVHMLNMRSISWMLIILVPISACVFDVAGKVFSNMYFPTQTQIHMEIAANECAAIKKKAKVLTTENFSAEVA